MDISLLPGYQKILSEQDKPGFRKAIESGVLRRRIARARKALKKCVLCERRCGTNRASQGKGFCGVGDRALVFGAHLHHGEEPELVPSGTIFFSGCTMKCAYCQNAPESIDPAYGEPWSAGRIARCIDSMAKAGAINVNFVGGDPTPFIPFILESLGRVESDIPVVFNSNAFFSEEAATLLKGIVDVYLLDFRYFSEECAARLSQAKGYVRAAKRNMLFAKKHGDLMIRLLVMPNHLECDAKPILTWIGENLGEVYLNILPQYRPCWRASVFEDISRPLSHEEYMEVVNFAETAGLARR